MGVDLSRLRRRELAQAIMATAAMEPLSTGLPHGPDLSDHAASFNRT